jgi:hypothetical protein
MVMAGGALAGISFQQLQSLGHQLSMNIQNKKNATLKGDRHVMNQLTYNRASLIQISSLIPVHQYLPS